MIDTNSRPLARLYGYRGKRNRTHFVGRKGLIRLHGKSVLIQKVLSQCNGYNSVREITKKLAGSSLEEVVEMLCVLEQYGIVTDSRELFVKFHEDSANPPFFSPDLGIDGLAKIMDEERVRVRSGDSFKIPPPTSSRLLQTIQQRQSTRKFAEGEIPLDKVSGILQATYGVANTRHWSVASGGGMYPLDLYLIVPGDSQQLGRGIYQWNPEENSLVTISGKNPNVWLSKVFNAHTLLEGAAYILCIAANFKRTAKKYVNRSYRLVLLEAGHAAQNTYLFCAEQGIGVVECGGFGDEALSKELGLESPYELVLTTLVLGNVDRSGRSSSVTDQEISIAADQLRHKLVGVGKPIVDVAFLDPVVKGHTMPLWAARALYRPVKGRLTALMRKKSVAFATGSTSSEALLKVLAEGYERYALEQYRSDRTEAACDLGEPFIDPRILVPYEPAQYKILTDLTRFNPRKKVDWVRGSRWVSGETVWVPMELVYYATASMKREKEVCYCASSNGVAAHFNKNIAVETALYELIERDAFSVMWYAKRKVSSVPHAHLSRDLRDRISYWGKLGYRVSVLDLTLDGPPVALVLIWSRERVPALCSGAACRPSLYDAALKAFNEAEFMAMTWQDYKPNPMMRPEEVNSPEGHGVFYLDPKKLTHLEWLLAAEECEKRREVFKGDLKQIDPVVADITPQTHECGLSVVRVLSERLMPINFGYGSEHRGHQRMDLLGLTWADEYPSCPHFFA
ncbi:MAG: YcaO-like family protein [Patescibacteria group bacterium]